MAMTVRVGVNYTGDIDNRVKAISDLLVQALPIPDDRYIDHISITRDLTIEGFAHVTLEALA
jgi:Holliday junction resolvase RusA-like endonuclease